MGKKILLADDSITIQKVIELTFSDEDFDVITVGNGRLALERLPEVRPDIVLCDIIMPEKDGYEVCEQIKGSAAFAHIPVLLLTGAFEPFDQERAARAGYDGSLAKPFEPETLIAKVKDLLARAPVRPAAAPPPIPRPAAPPPPFPPTVRPGAAPPLPSQPMARPAPPPTPSAATPPPAVLPFQRPAPPPSAPTAAPSFIPDEPFGGLDHSAFAEPAASPSTDTYAPVTPEESATLLAPPAPAPAPSQSDAASTVMFRAGDLPWAPAPSTPPEPPRAADPTARVTTVSPPEPDLVPEATEAVAAPTDYEEVLEEDLDFGVDNFEPEPEAGVSGSTIPPMGTSTLPPVPGEESTATGAFVPVPTSRSEAVPSRSERAEAAPMVEAEPIAELEPEAEPAAFAPEPPVFVPEAPRAAAARPAAALAPPPPAFAPQPPPVPPRSSAPEAPVRPPDAPRPPVTVSAPQPPVPPPVRPALASTPESFADLASTVSAPVAPAPPPSEAAAVSVPIETVEKIAQRVVAQISEKAVREIAWEVIPDLAEALIKQEIERLKAELQKT